MLSTRKCGPALRYLACVGALAGLTASAASAETFALTYTGAFSNADALNLAGATTTNFSGTTPFLITSYFDDTSPNIAAPVGVPGFVAYSPLSATLTMGGQTYNLTTYNQDPTHGITVAVYDNTTPFGYDASGIDHYGVGILQNPLADGAGIIGDWVNSSPDFSATHLVSTEFTNYAGVGFGAGPHDQMGNFLGVTVPISLTDAAGSPWLLTLHEGDEEYNQGAPLNTARIQAVPEPGSLALLEGMGVAGMGLLARRRRK